jgi:hypothetical protein
MKLESLKMNRLSSFVSRLYSVSCILSSVLTNKPNSPNVQMNANFFITMNYTIFTSLTKVKNKPNQTQNKPNFRNIEIVISSFMTSEYVK